MVIIMLLIAIRLADSLKPFTPPKSAALCSSFKRAVDGRKKENICASIFKKIFGYTRIGRFNVTNPDQECKML